MVISGASLGIAVIATVLIFAIACAVVAERCDELQKLTMQVGEAALKRHKESQGLYLEVMKELEEIKQTEDQDDQEDEEYRDELIEKLDEIRSIVGQINMQGVAPSVISPFYQAPVKDNLKGFTLTWDDYANELANGMTNDIVCSGDLTVTGTTTPDSAEPTYVDISSALDMVNRSYIDGKVMSDVERYIDEFKSTSKAPEAEEC